nr:probable leucine-rich repeat receptor-like protein kinase At1g35710 [Ipomoea batatas]
MQALERAEGRALLQWKETLSNTDGVLDSWSLSNFKNICNWTGITCNTAMYVSKMNLSGYNFNLTGTLYNFGFVSFPNLSHLVLSNNSFSGSIPSAIANLSKLTFLDLSQNYFESSIPLGITKLTRLRYLNLDGNNLNGTIPNQISHLHNLQHLDISFNSFSGQFSESIFSNLSKLQFFHCRSNLFQGRFPTNFTSYSMLKIISLYDNHFYGIIPQEVSRLTNLIVLDLGQNNFSGAIPPQIGNLNNLETFVLASNHLSGPIPSAFANMTNLIDLLLAHNNLKMQEALESVEGRALLQWKETLFNTDGVLDSWSHSNLKNLCNNWTGITCNATTATTYVSEINVRDYSNRLIGTLDHFDFISFPKLTHFVLSNNSFFGSIPSAIANLSKLTVLDLSYNGFQTSIPLGITMLTKLRYLSLGVNNLNSTIPDQISHLHNLEYLNISWNSFSGQFPESMYSNLTNLQYFICFGNQIQGWFPTNLTKLSNLRILDLSYNNFYGSIPHEISGLRNLNELYLGWNNFSGVIPLEIGKLKNLMQEALEISEGRALLQWKETLSNTHVLDSWSFSNLNSICNWTGITCSNTAPIYVSEINLGDYYYNLEGTLNHFDFISFPELTHFDLSSNHFTGSIPSAIANLSKLTDLDLSYNHFQRGIPLGIAMLTKLRHLNLKRNNLNGTIPSQISHLHNLEFFDISTNSFGVKFPESIFSNFTKLQSFGCMANQFQGPFPTNLTKLSNLKRLDLGVWIISIASLHCNLLLLVLFRLANSLALETTVFLFQIENSFADFGSLLLYGDEKRYDSTDSVGTGLQEVEMTGRIPDMQIAPA